MTCPGFHTMEREVESTELTADLSTHPKDANAELQDRALLPWEDGERGGGSHCPHPATVPSVPPAPHLPQRCG